MSTRKSFNEAQAEYLARIRAATPDLAALQGPSDAAVYAAFEDAEGGQFDGEDTTDLG